MKTAGKYLILLGLIASSSIVSAAEYADDMAAVYRAPSLDGVAGLMTMNLPYTMGAGMTIGVGGSYVNALPGVYQALAMGVGTLRIGFGDDIEIGIKAKGYAVNPYTGPFEEGFGDTEAVLKWKVRNQNENLPALAVELGGIFPTGDKDLGFTETENFGWKVGVTGGIEMPLFENSYLGLYGEWQWVAMDKVGDLSPYADTYGVTNFGIAFPISEENHLSAFVEFNETYKKTATLVNRNHSGFTPGFRLAFDNFSFTVAAQTVEFEGFPEVERRWMGKVSLGF